MRFLLSTLLLFCLSASLFADGESVLIDPVTNQPVRYAGKFSSEKVSVPVSYRPLTREMRGVWVATVENIDFPACQSSDQFKREYLQIVENLKNANINTIFFQVRPTCDAFYPSKINTVSRYLTGKEGQGLGGFDPMTFMVSEAHKRGIEFHAWLNPYRVIGKTPMRKNDYLKTLAPDNFAARNPQLVLEAPLPESGGYSLFLNPGHPRVVSHIVETVKEIVTKYPVDAIHFDDYFYLYTDIGSIDQGTYNQFNPNKLSLDNWRRQNVNTAIFEVKNYLNTFNRNNARKVAFGVSPFGIWANAATVSGGSLTGGKQSFVTQYADSRKWVKEGWVDYIIPQIYWPFGHDIAAYAALTDWWVKTVRGTNVNLYIGHAVYRLGAEKRWGSGELAAQLRYDRKYPEIKGSALFSYRSVFRPENAVMRSGVQRVLKDYWRFPVINADYKNLYFKGNK